MAEIVLDRLERMIPFTFEMIEAWTPASARCRRDDEVGVMIVTGAGVAFCSGGYILEMEDRLNNTPRQRKAELFASPPGDRHGPR